MLPDSSLITIGDNRSQVERFLNEIIITPRRQLKQWATITNQTPAAKVGYIGQHLASLITGVRGTRSGARGDDLADHTEVKTCSKIDQADKCKKCERRVLRQENVCANCGSTRIERKNDSKWLFSVKSQEELDQYLNMNRILLILMDYPRFKEKDFQDVRICAFEIYPQEERMSVFRDLISNHYYNIYRPKYGSGAKTNPMDFHPMSFQFYKCNPIKTFECIIKNIDTDASIEFLRFIDPRAERNSSVETEPMPTNLLEEEEWNILLNGTSFNLLKPYIINQDITEGEFRKMSTKKKAEVFPFLNEELRNMIPLREIKSSTQSTQYHRT